MVLLRVGVSLRQAGAGPQRAAPGGAQGRGGGALRALLGAGAALDAPTLASVLSPHLALGSTALHLAAARGHAPCVQLMLEAQAASPGGLHAPFLPPSDIGPASMQQVPSSCTCARSLSLLGDLVATLHNW